MNFPHGITETVANIFGLGRICSRAFAHQNANEPRPDWMLGQTHKNITTAARDHFSSRKGAPHPRRIKADIANIFEVGKLNFILGRERNSPTQAYGIDVLWRAKINDYPLWVEAIGVVGEMPVKIRVAFPERVRIAIVKPRVATIVCLVHCAATSWKVITVGA